MARLVNDRDTILADDHGEGLEGGCADGDGGGCLEVEALEEERE